MIEKLTKAEFIEKVFNFEKNQEWKYEGSVPAIVDFYGDWCPPCKMMDPVLESLSQDFDGKLVVYKINTDEESELAQVFGVQSVPSLLFIPLGDSPQMSVGALPKTQLNRVVREILKVN